MGDLGSQGSIKVESDAAPLVGSNPGQPGRPDKKQTSSVAPAPVPTFGSNDANKAK